MKSGYVIYLSIGAIESYIINPSPFGFKTTEDVEEATIYDTAREAYARATQCGLLDWKVGLR